MDTRITSELLRPTSVKDEIKWNEVRGEPSRGDEIGMEWEYSVESLGGSKGVLEGKVKSLGSRRRQKRTEQKRMEHEKMDREEILHQHQNQLCTDRKDNTNVLHNAMAMVSPPSFIIITGLRSPHPTITCTNSPHPPA